MGRIPPEWSNFEGEEREEAAAGGDDNTTGTSVGGRTAPEPFMREALVGNDEDSDNDDAIAAKAEGFF